MVWWVRCEKKLLHDRLLPTDQNLLPAPGLCNLKKLGFISRVVSRQQVLIRQNLYAIAKEV